MSASTAPATHCCTPPAVRKASCSAKRCAAQRRLHTTASGIHAPQQCSRHQRSLRVRASEGDPADEQKEGSTPQQLKDKSSSQEEAEKGGLGGLPRLEKGQGTAIVTGVVSIAFGVLYLVLIQLLDTRGTQLEPPPPEAFGL